MTSPLQARPPSAPRAWAGEAFSARSGAVQRGPQAVRAVTEDSTSSTGCSGNKLPELDMAHGRALPRPRPRHRADRAEQPGPLSSRPRPAPPASPSCETGGQHGCARGGGSRGCRPSPRSQLESESHLSTPPPLTKQVTWPVPCPPAKGGRESVSSKHSPLPFCGLAGKSVPRQRGKRPPWCAHVVDACSSPAMAPSFSQKHLSLSPEKPSACQPRCVVPPGATGFAAHTSPPTAGADPGEACGP